MSTSTVYSAATRWFHSCETLHCRKRSNKIQSGKKKKTWPVIQPYTSHQSMKSHITQYGVRNFALQRAFAYTSITFQPIRFNKIHVTAKLTAL